MEKWLLPRDSKETRTCFSCGSYKVRAKFYEWYPHPALIGVLGSNLNGIICSKCARREAGSKYWKEMENGRK